MSISLITGSLMLLPRRVLLGRSRALAGKSGWSAACTRGRTTTVTMSPSGAGIPRWRLFGALAGIWSRHHSPPRSSRPAAEPALAEAQLGLLLNDIRNLAARAISKP